jgi:hypothetical protein
MHKKNSGSIKYTQQTTCQSLKYYTEVDLLKKMKKILYTIVYPWVAGTHLWKPGSGMSNDFHGSETCG